MLKHCRGIDDSDDGDGNGDDDDDDDGDDATWAMENEVNKLVLYSAAIWTLSNIKN